MYERIDIKKSQVAMRERFTFFLLLLFSVCVFISSSFGAREKRVAIPEDFVNIRQVSDVQLSPDGKLAAFVVTDPADPKEPSTPRKSDIWTVAVDGGGPARPLAVGAGCDSLPRWSPDGCLLAFLSRRGSGCGGGESANQIFLLRTEDNTLERMTDLESDIEQIAWSPDGTMIAFTSPVPPADRGRRKKHLIGEALVLDQAPIQSSLWILDIASRKVERIAGRDFHVSSMTWSPDGRELALVISPTPSANDILWRSSLVVVSSRDGETLRKLSHSVGFPEAGVFASVDWSPDGRMICFTEYAPAKIGIRLALVPAKGGAMRHILLEHKMTVRRARWYPDSRNIIADCRHGVRTEMVAIDTESESLEKLAAIFAGRPDFSISRDARTIAYIGERPHSASDVWLLERGRKPLRLTDFHPQLGALDLGDIREISWKNRKDGLTLYGLVITPPGYESEKPLPTIVHIHGGPCWSWWMGWHGSWSLWGQLLASNGYAVFLPNPRGSTDQGWRFAQASLNDWGGGDFRDIMDGVNRLIEEGIADPDRLGIGGWSYGGYMSAWAVTQSDRFKAAVVGAGITDLSSFHGTTDINPSYLNVYFPDCIFPCRKTFNDHSPMNFIRACRTPTLVLHPVDDRRVPFGQGLQFYKGLKELGIETQMAAYPGEGHGLIGRAHQQDVLVRILDWFDMHVKHRVLESTKCQTGLHSRTKMSDLK